MEMESERDRRWEHVSVRGGGRNERRDKFVNREEIKDNRKGYSDKQEVEKSKYGGKYKTERSRDLTRNRIDTRRISENSVRGRAEERERTSRDRRTEAIVVHKSDQVSTYADILRNIKRNIDINEIGIEETRIRRTMAGSLLIQITGDRSKEKADILAERMKSIVGSEAKIARPSRKAELRITGVDEDTTQEEIIESIALEGGCDKAEVVAGIIRRNRVGLGSIWVKYPWNAAKDLSRRGNIKIDWVRVRVELLDPPPVQCFRCWEYGHLKIQCRSNRDIMGRCYRCGSEGHRATQCGETHKCLLCMERGVSHKHRMRSRECITKITYSEKGGHNR